MRVTRPVSSGWSHTRGLGVLAVAVGTLVVPLDSSVNFAFPYITHAVGLPIPAIQWVIISYTLTYAALMLVFGRVGDMLGYRRIFLVGSLWSAIAFVLCAMAPSYGTLLAARVMQGIGAALVLSCGPALATSLYGETARTRILGVYTMAIVVAGVRSERRLPDLLVPLIDWPAVFWFRVAACAVRIPARLAAAGRHTPVSSRDVRCTGRPAACAGDQRDVARTESVAAQRPVVCPRCIDLSSCRGMFRRLVCWRVLASIINLHLFHDFDFSLPESGG